MRAAACTALAFLSCHRIGAEGDECLVGPFRQALLDAGALAALLRAALGARSGSEADEVDRIVQQSSAVGIMYLATQVSSA